MPTHERPRWLTRSDERILECLAEGGRGSPDTIAADDRVSLGEERVTARLATLSETPLVDQFGLRYYELTPTGRDFLRGSFDARNLPEPEG